MANPKVAEAVKGGQQAHKDFSAKVDAKPGWKSNVPMKDAAGKPIFADAVTSGGHPLELKPRTPAGVKKGAAQLPKYEKATGKNGRVVYYDPATPQNPNR
jgi:hypothetical protein